MIPKEKLVVQTSNDYADGDRNWKRGQRIKLRLNQIALDIVRSGCSRQGESLRTSIIDCRKAEKLANQLDRRRDSEKGGAEATRGAAARQGEDDLVSLSDSEIIRDETSDPSESKPTLPNITRKFDGRIEDAIRIRLGTLPAGFSTANLRVFCQQELEVVEDYSYCFRLPRHFVPSYMANVSNFDL